MVEDPKDIFSNGEVKIAVYDRETTRKTKVKGKIEKRSTEDGQKEWQIEKVCFGN